MPKKSNLMKLDVYTPRDSFEPTEVLNNNTERFEDEFSMRSVNIEWYMEPGVSAGTALEKAIATGKYVFIPEDTYFIDRDLDLSKVWGYGTLNINGQILEVFNPLKESRSVYADSKIQRFIDSAEKYASFAADAKHIAETADLTDWKSPVSTLTQLPLVYPNATDGYTVQVLDTGKIYRYKSNSWVNVAEYGTGPLTYLSSIKADKSYVDTLVQSVANGSPKGVYPTLSALQTAKPSGDAFIYLTTDTNNWNYWNGNSWVPGGLYRPNPMQPNDITNKYLAPKSIDPFKHSLAIPVVLKVQPKNRFNKNTMLSGSYVKYSDGSIAANPSYGVSDYIYVKPNTAYTMTKRDQTAWYDSDMKYISGITAGPGQVYTSISPANASYVRVSLLLTDADTFMFEEGSSASPYEPYYTDLLLEPEKYFKPGSIGDTLISQSFKDKYTRLTRVDEIMMKKLTSPTQSVQIKLLGDSITHGVGGTGYAENGETIPGTTVKMNPSGYCWANTLRDLLSSKYGGLKTLQYNDDRYIKLKTTSKIVNPTNYQFNNLIPGESLLDFSFKSDELKVIVMTYANGGKVDVYIDDVYHSTLDTYAPSLTQYVELSVSVPFGQHTLTLKGTNTKNASSGGYLFTFYGFKLNKRVTLVNYAQSGKNSSHIYTQRNTLIQSSDDFVIMQLGTNDRHNLQSPEDTKYYQRGIMETAYSKGAQVILMSACPTTVSGDNDPIRRYGMYDVDKAIRELALEYGMDYISNYDAFLEYSEYRGINMDTILADGLHPNDTGYDVMFRNIVRSLKLNYVRPGITK